MKKLTVFYKSSFLILFIFNLNFASCNEKKEELRTENEKTNNLPSYKNLKSDSSDYIIELVAENLYVPWSIVFTDSSRMLFTERSGNLRVILNGVLEEKPLKVFEEVSSEGEEGLMGLALDPEYENNKFIFVSYAYMENDKM
ncbi:MAG TPA: PQQ-dependent sugar dehydrogenase, partial [Ignavibacteria bacterium]|nr:PQQ-dependent sugar dehydrogenase [Ignavibacteria bacterium]